MSTDVDFYTCAFSPHLWLSKALARLMFWYQDYQTLRASFWFIGSVAFWGPSFPCADFLPGLFGLETGSNAPDQAAWALQESHHPAENRPSVASVYWPGKRSITLFFILHLLRKIKLWIGGYSPMLFAQHVPSVSLADLFPWHVVTQGVGALIVLLTVGGAGSEEDPQT